MTMHDHHEMHTTHATHDSDHSSRAMALSATLHCLTGFAIGEISGLMIGTAAGLGTAVTVALSIALAFAFGYTLSTFPLLRSGLGVGAALSLVLAADTLSILTMEVADNAVMALIPGAMDAGLVNPVFWVGMMIALTVAFAAAYPVNRWLMARGKGHALTHKHHAAGPATGARRWIPNLSTATLTGVIIAFMVGGLVVSVAADPEPASPAPGHAAKNF